MATKAEDVKMDKTVELEDKLYRDLKNFKNVFEAVVEKEIDFDNYVNFVLSFGLERMLRDAIPEGQEWNTLLAIFEKDSKYICDLVSEIYKKGEGVSEEERKGMKESVQRYIG
ncbi:MAG TPA: hypothetical protein ENI78_01745 [Euryarchaeota archaeon]|nr:hypothetical protein [Euryarchaeota archaeon]